MFEQGQLPRINGERFCAPQHSGHQQAVDVVQTAARQALCHGFPAVNKQRFGGIQPYMAGGDFQCRAQLARVKVFDGIAQRFADQIGPRRSDQRLAVEEQPYDGDQDGAVARDADGIQAVEALIPGDDGVKHAAWQLQGGGQ